MRNKWFELSVNIDGYWENFEDDNLLRLVYRVVKAKSNKKRIGQFTINFPG